MFVYSVLPIVLLAAAGVSAATAPLDIVSSLILALPVSPLCTVSSACSALSTLAPACFDPSLAGNAQGQAQCACTVGFTNAMESCALCLAEDPCYTASPRSGPLLAVQLFQQSCSSTNPAVKGVPLTNQVTVRPGTCGQVDIIPVPTSTSVTSAPISSGSVPYAYWLYVSGRG